MTMSRTLKIVLLAGFVSLVDPEAAIELAGTDSFSIVSSAEAVVGRPLTPVSVARCGASLTAWTHPRERGSCDSSTPGFWKSNRECRDVSQEPVLGAIR